MGTMNVKSSTKAFGSVSPELKSTNSEVKNMSAGDLSKLGGEDVGDVLNKVADPNWIDPSKKMRAVGSDKMDKDAFFRLMMAQMKNQDPTNPLKSHEMAAQLANFSSLEQMQNMNTTLTDMKNAQKPTEQFQALNLIGKSVAGDSAILVRSKDDHDHDFRFSLPGETPEMSIKIKNSDGLVVRTYNLKNLKAGDNRITWNGLDENGRAATAGEYSFIVEAKNASGQKTAVKTNFDGVITGVNFTSEGPVLMVGTQTIRMRDVKKITDPQALKQAETQAQRPVDMQAAAAAMTGLSMSPQQNDQISADSKALDLKGQGGTAENEKSTANQAGSQAKGTADNAAPAAPKSNSGLGQMMSSVGMSSEMMSKLAKETKEEK